jgi:MATE family multidrug resistance protein
MAPDRASSGPITHARVLKIALPIALSNATIPILGAVDTGVIGQLGQAAPIGAVGMGAVILASVYWIFGFLRMGTSGLVAQARGAGDAPEGGAILIRALMIAAAAGLAMIALQGGLVWAAFRIAPASAEVEGLARQYIAVRIYWLKKQLLRSNMPERILPASLVRNQKKSCSLRTRLRQLT